MSDADDAHKTSEKAEDPAKKDEPQPQARARKRKSNRPYPPAAFEDAVRFCKSIYDFAPGQSVRKLSFFDHVGKSPDSSAARDAITNANKYGLLKSSFASEQLELTADALIIVGENVSPREQAKAKVRLGIESIEVFQKVYVRIAGVRLPAMAAIADLMREVVVPDDLVQEAVDLFVVNLRFVGLLQVLAGAERVVTIDHLLDNLPSVQEVARVSSFQASHVNHEPEEGRTLVTQQHADFETTCFYVTPIGSPESEQRKHSDLFLGALVEPAMTPLGLRVIRADAIDKPGIITRQVIEYILKSRLVIADLSFHNPNVFYELALRHAVRLPIVQIVREIDGIPFDINQMRTIRIDNRDIYTFTPKIEIYRSEITAQSRRALEAGTDVDTPVSNYFPNSVLLWHKRRPRESRRGILVLMVRA